MRICILTQPLFHNYGGLLQAFALQKVLRDKGHNVVTDKNGVRSAIAFHTRIVHFIYHTFKKYLLSDKRYNPYRYLFTKYNTEHIISKKLRENTDRFIEQHISTVDFFQGKIYPSKDMIEQFDTLIVGSDQVWRSVYSHTPTYFLNFTSSLDIKRIAYAASFGSDNIDEYKSSEIKECKESAVLFDAISVREESGVRICKDYFGVNSTHVLDPTMLLEKEDYITTIEDEDKIRSEDSIMCYLLDKNKESSKIVNKVALKLNFKVLDLMPKKQGYIDDKEDINDYVYPSVSKWIAGFRDAEFVVTDSFHGTVFSIIFNKPFLAIVNQNRGADRFISLLKIFGLENRLISSLDELTDEHLANIDFDKVNKIRQSWQQKSFTFLDTALR